MFLIIIEYEIIECDDKIKISIFKNILLYDICVNY